MVNPKQQHQGGFLKNGEIPHRNPYTYPPLGCIYNHLFIPSGWQHHQPGGFILYNSNESYINKRALHTPPPSPPMGESMLSAFCNTKYYVVVQCSTKWTHNIYDKGGGGE